MYMKKTILLIEDDEAIIEIYKIALGKAGFKVEVISLGEKAKEKVKEMEQGKADKPDLVLLDLVLPDMNGIKILEEIRKQKTTKDLPVFVLTNYTDRELEKIGNYLKSERYLLKANFTPTQLVEIIKERLGKKK